jgi:hypothetical protein
MENLAFFLSRLSSLVIEAWASCACSLRRGMSYGGGTVPAMAVHEEWWLLINSLAWYMACLLLSWPSSWRSDSLGPSHDVTVQGEWLVPSRVACS